LYFDLTAFDFPAAPFKRLTQTVNRAVSFNAVKNLALDLLLAADSVVPDQSLLGTALPQSDP
jgi:hypothetical protein